MAWLEDEFWWLAELGEPLKGFVKVGRNIWTSPPELPKFEESSKLMALDELEKWAKSVNWENVHRSLTVFDSPGGEPRLAGPLVVDIDAEEDDDGAVSKTALEDAGRRVIEVVNHYIALGWPEEGFRVFFSGHKGFHVELASRAKRECFNADGWGPWYKAKMKSLRSSFPWNYRSSSIDSCHEFKRLHGSWNVWGQGNSNRARVVNLPAAELEPAMRQILNEGR